MNPLSPLATLFVLVVGVVLPWLAWRSARRLAGAGHSGEGGVGEPRAPTITRRTYYISAFTTQTVTLGFALAVAREVGMPVLVGPFRVEPLAWLATAVVIGGLLATLPWRWRTRSPAMRRRQAAFAPRTPAQALANVALCLMAGIGEEITYRGVLHGNVWYATGSWWLATAACAASFGLAHAPQGHRSMFIIGGIAVWMHVTVFWTGSLHLAIVVHAVYDLIATFTIARWVRRDEAAASPGTSATLRAS